MRKSPRTAPIKNPETGGERVVELLEKRASLMIFRSRYECYLDNLPRKVLNYPCVLSVLPFFLFLISLDFVLLFLYLFFDPPCNEGLKAFIWIVNQS